MSSGREHTEIGVIGVIASAIVSLLFGDTRALLLPIGVAANTYLLQSDLDLSKSDVRNNWGLLGFIWFPFALIIPHRSPFSHWPVIGTITKNAYLLIVIGGIVSALTSWIQVKDFVLNNIFSDLTKWFFIGQTIGDGLHLIMDLTSTAAKRIRRR